ncbi:hypothetical protein GUJ93_ZPchr0006g45730 [Zizania palustris]|uniref:Uncharacterized protein n=1 Tax=Zizania palustris TaxID=103762 RepID=A0A8J5SIH3_ZIZPA|nr:hypothetical protein GUJ93_ZPchr0006g45730 [Zizania palustris]
MGVIKEAKIKVEMVAGIGGSGAATIVAEMVGDGGGQAGEEASHQPCMHQPTPACNAIAIHPCFSSSSSAPSLLAPPPNAARSSTPRALG